MKTLSLNILDIVQNSIRAHAKEISIVITESVKDDLLRIIIRDDGTGIPGELLSKITDPFVTTRTKRRMGLGLSLLKYHSEIAGGSLNIGSETGKGTEVNATFILSHIDRQPIGDIPGVIVILIASNPCINFIYTHITDSGEYRFSSAETKKYLEIESLYDRNLLEDIGDMIRENLKLAGASG